LLNLKKRKMRISVTSIVVRSIYGKFPLNPQNIGTKGFSTDGSTENMESHCSKKS